MSGQSTSRNSLHPHTLALSVLMAYALGQGWFNGSDAKRRVIAWLTSFPEMPGMSVDQAIEAALAIPVLPSETATQDAEDAARYRYSRDEGP